MLPKLALDVMSCEVMRVLQLTDSCIVPVSYQVPRKVGEPTHTAEPWPLDLVLIKALVPCDAPVLQHSGQEFHEDLYPDTTGPTPAMSAEEWWKGGNQQVTGRPPPLPPHIHRLPGPHSTGSSSGSTRLQVGKVSLNPDKRPKQPTKPAAGRKDMRGGSKEVRDEFIWIICCDVNSSQAVTVIEIHFSSGCFAARISFSNLCAISTTHMSKPSAPSGNFSYHF